MLSNQQLMAKPRRLPLWLGWALVSLPIVVAYGILLRNFIAIPIIDDYPELIAFAIEFEKSPGLMAKLGLLFTAQIGPYKLLLDHSLVALQLVFFGHLNFTLLILLGNLMPLCIFFLLQKHIAPSEARLDRRWLFLLPVSLLLFSLNYAETLDWAMIGLQHPAVILFTLMSLHFLLKREAKSFVAACLLGILASATSANGLLLWPVGLLYLLIHDRRVSRLIGWGVSLGLTLFMYFFRYQPATISAHGSVAAKLLFLTMFCGGAMENMHHRPLPYVSVLIGALVLLCFLDAVRTRYDRRNPFFFFAMVWLVMTAAVVANGRIAMGIDLSLSSRYKIFCELLLICSFMYLLDRIQSRSATEKKILSVRAFCVGSSVAGVLICVGGDVAGAHMLSLRKMHAETAMQQYVAAPFSASPMFLIEDTLSAPELEEEGRARDELNEAIRLGIYKPPTP